MANLAFIIGTIEAGNFVRVGHNSGSTNNDAVWSFVATSSSIKELQFVFSWNNDAADTGWSGAYSYVAAISTSGAAGMIAATGTVVTRITQTLSGITGTAVFTFNNLTLTSGATYYIRLNMNGTTTSTMKAFYINGNTYTINPLGTMYANDNGAWRRGIPYINVGGVWRQGVAYVNINGVWKQGL